MKRRKVLIIGESDMVYIKEYVENMLKYDHDISFTIITFSKKRYLDFYKRKGIKLIELHYEQETLDLSSFDKLIIRLLYSKFDYVHVQAVSINAIVLAKMIAGNKSKIIVTYWGFPKSRTEMTKIQPFLKELYKISFVTENLQKYFWNFYGEGYMDKSYCFDFGLGCIEHMRKLSHKLDISSAVSEGKRKMNFPKDRIVVAIGYCGRADQQHLAVLNAIEKLPVSILSRLYLFLHFSYSVSNVGYKRQVMARLKDFDQYGCQHELSEKYLVDDQMAFLRYGVDVFVNTETMDALSGSMLEYFFGGALVFNPRWLDYGVLKKNGINYIEYSDFEDLTGKLEEYLIRGNRMKSNRKPIWNMCSWKKLIPQWNDLYQ